MALISSPQRTELSAQLVKNLPAMQGDSGSIPGLGISAGGGIGYPLQYSWTSLVVQLVKNPSVRQETWVQSLGWEDSLEKGKATHSSILAWRIPWSMDTILSKTNLQIQCSPYQYSNSIFHGNREKKHPKFL